MDETLGHRGEKAKQKKQEQDDNVQELKVYNAMMA